MNKSKGAGDERWDRGWDEHQRRQDRRLAEIPFAQKLEWLEEAQDFGEKLMAQANRSKTTER